MSEPALLQKSPARLLSLDVFRGITVAAMILVNNPGDWGHIYPPLEHAEWNGCTPTDLIFPFFLFIVGVSISFALGSKKEIAADHNKLLFTAAKRAIILIILGLIIQSFRILLKDPAQVFPTLRIPGVLQRIAIVFFITVWMFLKTSTKTQFRTLIIILIIYWVIMTFIPVPGVGAANLEKETNMGAWIDRSIFTEAHLWSSSKTWDPEGLLGTLPAVSTGLFGLLVGKWLKRKDKDDAVKISWMFSVGFLAVILGLIWDLFFPINKALWTSSYVLFAGGLATISLAFCYWIIDVNHYKSVTRPFVVFGVNAIAVFFLSAILPQLINLIKVTTPGGIKLGLIPYAYQTFIIPYFSPVNASLVYAVTFVLIWLLILWMMYNKKIIIKV
ncbi:MAG: hypothetical protein JWN56_1950 [Sphingobacteriales bacterium]|nr:hypothetical protein [Sphingobacteriales bacterium]